MKKKLKKFVLYFLRSFIDLLFLNEKIRKISLTATIEIYAKLENLNYNFKENGEFWLIKSISGFEEEILFDIGANIGDYSLELQKQNPHSSIYCFEASPKTFKKLLLNISKSPNIFPFCFGLSDETKTGIFYECEEFSGRNTLEAEKTRLYYKNNYPIELKKGDNVLDELNIRKNITLLKLDVEGHELNVLKGFSKSLRELKIDLIQFERATAAATPKIVEFYDLLKPFGYAIGKLYPNYIEIYETYSFVLEEYIGCNWIAINIKSKTFSKISSSIKFVKTPQRRV